MKNPLDQYFAVIKRFIPEKPVKPAIGLDIGVSSCKMVELERKNGSFQLVNGVIEPIVGGDKKKAVKTALSKLRSPSNSPVTALYGKRTLIRYIDMPQMTLKELKKSFAFEIDRYFPFTKEQVYTDCYILDKEGKGDKMSVLAAAAKKELVDERIEFFKDLGLQSNFITFNSIALANVLNVLGLQDEPGDRQADSSSAKEKQGTPQKEKASGAKKETEGKDSQAVAILDMGEEVCNLIIMEQGLPRFTRDIFVGGRDFTKNISSSSDMSLEEAEKLKCQPGVKLTDILGEKNSTVLNLALELRLSLDYFVTERSIPVSQLLLTGGTSLLDGWEAIFSKYLEIRVRKWNPLTSLGLPDIPNEELNNNSGRLAVALGLALY